MIAKHGGRYLTKGGQPEFPWRVAIWKPKRVVIIEFPDMQSLDNWYSSPEYQTLIALRNRCTSDATCSSPSKGCNHVKPRSMAVAQRRPLGTSGTIGQGIGLTQQLSISALSAGESTRVRGQPARCVPIPSAPERIRHWGVSRVSRARYSFRSRLCVDMSDLGQQIVNKSSPAKPRKNSEVADTGVVGRP